MTSILNVYNSHKCHAYVSIACVRLYVFNSLPKMVRFYALTCFDFSFQFISIKFVKSRPTDSFKSFDTRTHANKHPLVALTHTHVHMCVHCTSQYDCIRFRVIKKTSAQCRLHCGQKNSLPNMVFQVKI